MADGPLHILPFDALVRSAEDDHDRGWQYLVEWRPLHKVVSMTVHDELGKRRARATI